MPLYVITAESGKDQRREGKLIERDAVYFAHDRHFSGSILTGALVMDITLAP
jgi:hypothetical protein